MLAALDHAARGLDGGFDRLNDATASIRRDGAGGDLAATMVDVLKARQDVRANAAVVRTADEMIGTLLDVLA
jgi:hypothetical protein